VDVNEHFFGRSSSIVTLRCVQTRRFRHSGRLLDITVRNRHLAKSISDAAWSQFRSCLAYKAESAGRQIVEVNPAYTSQTCSSCGHVAKKPLKERWHHCPICGLSLDRDTNAAFNILETALKTVWDNRALPAGTPWVRHKSPTSYGWGVVTAVHTSRSGSPVLSRSQALDGATPRPRIARSATVRPFLRSARPRRCGTGREAGLRG
jgi:hypothetical protein